MRNQFFLLTVLAVICWTGRGDQPGNDFYLDDEDEGSDVGSGSYDDSWESSLSSYDGESSFDMSDSSGDGSVETEVLAYGIHLNMLFVEDYSDPESFEYNRLSALFIQVVGETMQNSPLKHNYVETVVNGFSPGSVVVDFEIEISSLGNTDQMVAEEAVAEVLKYGIVEGRLDELMPNASSLVIKTQTDPTYHITTSTTANSISPGDDIKETNIPYDPKGKDPNYRTNNPDVKKTDNILDMILGDPIIIAAIVGGLIVILLSAILLFLFVVYRLKKKDEGSYSLDEPAKSKDPTVYWKETKEFYA